MNSLSLIFIFVLSPVLQQSRCNLHYDRFLLADWEPRDSLACYRTSTLNLFKNMKTVVEESCIREGEEEFKSKVNPRASTFRLISKNGPYHEQFVEGKKQAEEICSKTITKIRDWLSNNCSDEKQQRVNRFTKIFRKESSGCGDPNYLSDKVTTLENTCAVEEKEGISDHTKSYNDIRSIDTVSTSERTEQMIMDSPSSKISPKSYATFQTQDKKPEFGPRVKTSILWQSAFSKKDSSKPFELY